MNCKRWVLLSATALCVGVASPIAAVAQEVERDSLVAEREKRKDRTEVTTVEDVPLNNSGADVNARLSEIMRLPEGQGFDRVKLLGRARVANSPDGPLGQVVWYGIEAEGKRVRRGSLPQNLNSAFLTESRQLPRATDLVARGDVENMVELARRLLEEANAEEAEEPQAKEGEDQKEREARSTPMRSSQGAATNDQAQFQPFDVQRSEKDDPAPHRSTYETSDGCAPVVNLEQGIVQVQSKLITMEDGTQVEDSGCQPLPTSYPIQWSYGGCTDDVDLESGLAYAQARPYWVDDMGSPQYVADCTPREEEVFTLVKDYDSCRPDFDIEAMQGVRRFELVYSNRRGVRTVVEGCRQDEETVFALRESPDGCEFRHDISQDISYRQKRVVFEDNQGVEQAISSCRDSGDPYPHEFDMSVCEPIIDMEGKSLVPRARRSISTDNGTVAIADCEPLEDEAQNLKTTKNGCEYNFVHNLSAGESLATWRFYHDLTGFPEYVTECVPSDEEPIPHEYETLRWEHDDAKKQSNRIDRVTINAAGGELEVAAATIIPGRQPTPYVFQATEYRPDRANEYYEGCNVYSPTFEVEVYERADGSEAEYVIGDGPPQGPTDGCHREIEYREHLSTARNPVCVGSPTSKSYFKRTRTTQPNGSVTNSDWTSIDYREYGQRPSNATVHYSTGQHGPISCA